MSEETLVIREDKDAIIASLMESVDCLREEIGLLRNNNRILRRVHSALRSANASLRQQLDLAVQNDELFKRFCNGEFDAEVTKLGDGGLPEPEQQAEAQA